MMVLYVSGVTQFILITLFVKLFVEYCSSSAVSYLVNHCSIGDHTVYEYWWGFVIPCGA